MPGQWPGIAVSALIEPNHTLYFMADMRRPPASIEDAFPNLLETADILNITNNSLRLRIPSLARRTLHRDDELRFPPDVIFDLSRIYRSRAPSDVAASLVELAERKAPQFTPEIERQVNALLDSEAVHEISADRQRFLKEAKRWLPPELYAQTEAAVKGNHPPAFGGSTTSVSN